MMLSTATCSGLCAAGSFCAGGGCTTCTTCPVLSACPSSGMTAPLPCGRNTTTTVMGTATACPPCPAGRFCASIGGPSTICPAGSYCIAGSAAPTAPCPGGSWSAAGDPGSRPSGVCAGTCSAGYYCPTGSTSGNVTVCPRGSFCPAASGAPVPCPAGVWGARLGLSTAVCDGACGLGYVCGAGSTTPAVCPAGYYCSSACVPLAAAAAVGRRVCAVT
jgi:hypothetical protein